LNLKNKTKYYKSLRKIITEKKYIILKEIERNQVLIEKIKEELWQRDIDRMGVDVLGVRREDILASLELEAGDDAEMR
jgi:hypothetical protein